MNKEQAYKTLELSTNATETEAKKAFKKLAAKYHPDTNKDPTAESKFKEINAAYQYIQNPTPERESAYHNPHNPFNPFGQQRQVVQLENVELNVTISFKESVLGCSKEVKYARKAKCQVCEGSGQIRINNGCTKCGGKRSGER